MLTVPDPSEPIIRDFCRTIRADSPPLFAAVRPAADAKTSDCFANARRVVDRSGGRIIFGWAIYGWPRVYVEAEHHAVFENPSGELIDVTPPLIQNITHTLFLPDDSAIWDFDNEGVRRHNRRLALNSDPLIKALFKVKEEHDDIMDAIPGVGEVTIDLATAARLNAITEKNMAISKAIAWKFTRRNDPCFCGSDKKFKKCHGAGDRR